MLYTTPILSHVPLIVLDNNNIVAFLLLIISISISISIGLVWFGLVWFGCNSAIEYYRSIVQHDAFETWLFVIKHHQRTAVAVAVAEHHDMWYQSGKVAVRALSVPPVATTAAWIAEAMHHDPKQQTNLCSMISWQRRETNT
jgi:hypothetical protein